MLLVLLLLQVVACCSFSGYLLLNPKSHRERVSSSRLVARESIRMVENESKNFRVRTVTAFVFLRPEDFSETEGLSSQVSAKVEKCATSLRAVERQLLDSGYEIQTLRIVTNPFGEWLYDGDVWSVSSSKTADVRLGILDSLLSQHDIKFCSLGPSETAEQTTICPQIISASFRFSCSASVGPADVDSARASAQSVLEISRLGEQEGALDHVANGLGNFRFCAAASCKPFIPFFPAAKSSPLSGDDSIGIALGLENGALVKELLQQSKSVSNIATVFRNGMEEALSPLQDMCQSLSMQHDFQYLGIDSSLNPSLDAGGSVAEAIEQLDEVRGDFGGAGTLAAAAAITTALQSMSLKLTGYCGLMLPVCEDRRLAELASSEEPSRRLQISNLLSISSVCGVGVDTVPIPGDSTVDSLAALILDVAGLAGRWEKSLSVRVFPVVGGAAGDFTTFDSPYMCNCRILRLD